MQKENLVQLKRKLISLGAAVSLASIMGTTPVQAKPQNQKQEIDFVHEMGIANADGIIHSLREKGILDTGAISSILPLEYLEELTYLDYHSQKNIHMGNASINYDWLYHCSNVEEVSFTNTNVEEMKRVLSIIRPKKIDSIRMDYLNNTEVNEVLKALKNIEVNCLEIKPSIRPLTEIADCKVDFSLVNSVKELTIKGDVYDLPIVFTQADIELLKDKGIHLKYDLVGGSKEDLFKVEKDLEDYYKILDIHEDDNEHSKIVKIMNFVVNQYSYSPKVASMSEEESENCDFSEFYLYGYLCGNYNADQICGNYAALVNALAIRCGLNSWIVSGYDHAFNIIKTGKDYYIYDATWSDDNKEHLLSDGSSLRWFGYILNKEEFKNSLDNHHIDNELYESIEKEVAKSYNISVDEYRRGIK